MEVVATLRNSIEERISELRSSEEAWQHINFMCVYIYILALIIPKFVI